MLTDYGLARTLNLVGFRMEDSSIQKRNQRLGLVLFTIYLVLYTGFILLCAFAPGVMEWRPMGRLNLAIVYGFGLIIAAFVMAMIYGLLCQPEQEQERNQ